jgi:hypothetical protein
MARRARLASREAALVLADGRAETAGPRPARLAGCAAGTPSRSPPRKREDVTGPQRAEMILVRLGRNRKLSADVGTLKEYREEVKSMNEIL